MRCQPLLRAIFALLVCALPPAFPARAGDGEPTLYVYTWMGYFDSDVINNFQKQYNCRVDMTFFVSNEDLHHGIASMNGDYDLLTPSSFMAERLWREGKLQELDHAAIPNIRGVDPAAAVLAGDAQMRYSIPYTRTICGVAYNKRQVPEKDLGGWGIFDNPLYRGRMTMLDSMRETIGAALKYLGYSLNTTDDNELARAGVVLRRWKGGLSTVLDDSDRAIADNDDRVISHTYNGDVALLMAENPDVGFYIPAEGSSQVSDDFVIPADAEHVDLAHAFINHVLRPETAKANMEGIFFYMPVPEALAMLRPELRDSPAFAIPDEVVARCEVIRDLGRDIVKYERLWTDIMGEG